MAAELQATSPEAIVSSNSDITTMMIDGVDFAVGDDDDQLSVLSDSSYQRYV